MTKEEELIAELRKREKTLIDLCHSVDAKLQAMPQTPEIAALVAELEPVRLWWYPTAG